MQGNASESESESCYIVVKRHKKQKIDKVLKVLENNNYKIKQKTNAVKQTVVG